MATVIKRAGKVIISILLPIIFSASSEINKNYCQHFIRPKRHYIYLLKLMLLRYERAAF
jgi:hypothetical protein